MRVRYLDRAQRSCKTKQRYETETDANAVGAIHGGLRAYPCRHCKGWHLSSRVDVLRIKGSSNESKS